MLRISRENCFHFLKNLEIFVSQTSTVKSCMHNINHLAHANFINLSPLNELIYPPLAFGNYVINIYCREESPQPKFYL